MPAGRLGGADLHGGPQPVQAQPQRLAVVAAQVVGLRPPVQAHVSGQVLGERVEVAAAVQPHRPQRRRAAEGAAAAGQLADQQVVAARGVQLPAWRADLPVDDLAGSGRAAAPLGQLHRDRAAFQQRVRGGELLDGLAVSAAEAHAEHQQWRQVSVQHKQLPCELDHRGGVGWHQAGPVQHGDLAGLGDRGQPRRGGTLQVAERVRLGVGADQQLLGGVEAVADRGGIAAGGRHDLAELPLGVAGAAGPGRVLPAPVEPARHLCSQPRPRAGMAEQQAHGAELVGDHARVAGSLAVQLEPAQMPHSQPRWAGRRVLEAAEEAQQPVDHGPVVLGGGQRAHAPGRAGALGEHRGEVGVPARQRQRRERERGGAAVLAGEADLHGGGVLVVDGWVGVVGAGRAGSRPSRPGRRPRPAGRPTGWARVPAAAAHLAGPAGSSAPPGSSVGSARSGLGWRAASSAATSSGCSASGSQSSPSGTSASLVSYSSSARVCR